MAESGTWEEGSRVILLSTYYLPGTSGASPLSSAPASPSSDQGREEGRVGGVRSGKRRLADPSAPFQRTAEPAAARGRGWGWRVPGRRKGSIVQRLPALPALGPSPVPGSRLSAAWEAGREGEGRKGLRE